ncbi:MAG: hypothetical protein SO170_01905 [Butyribacter sp.]|nr:hypothetical protein [bacterium]MDY3853707.1 hypothetical protein [Butyribacter sp.]
MSQQKEIVQKTMTDLQETVDLFYQQKKKTALKKLDTVLGELMTAIDTLFAYKAEHTDFPLDEGKLTNALKDAMNALQEGDHVLLADILQYDFLEYMEELSGQME